MELVERDFEILKWIHKFRFCLGRHIRVLAGFSGVRATNRRLKILLEAGYLERKKYMYGVPYLYTLTHKGRILSGSNKRQDKIRIDRIMHDISVLDTVVYYASLYRRSSKSKSLRTVIIISSSAKTAPSMRSIGVISLVQGRPCKRPIKSKAERGT
jgi:hypothetical protein